MNPRESNPSSLKRLLAGQNLKSDISMMQPAKDWNPAGGSRSISGDLALEVKAVVLESVAQRNRRVRDKRGLVDLFERVGELVRDAALSLNTDVDLDVTASWPGGFGITFSITGVYQIIVLQLLGVVAGGGS
jgi:hypothetical protein